MKVASFTIVLVTVLLGVLNYNYKYTFDQVLTYEVIKPGKRDTTKIKFHVNSQNNDFFTIIKFEKKKSAQLYFTDFNGKAIQKEIPLDRIEKVESENFGPFNYAVYSNPYKFQVGNYNFRYIGDTVIKNAVLKKYLLKSTKPNIEKRKKLWHEIYAIDTTKSSLPLLWHPTAYEVWKKRKNIPNGIIVEKYYYNYQGKLEVVEKLESHSTSTFSISLID
ncbi:MAG: hypothetical protein EOO46_20515 [Flavobacterium sp.]|nr:MAG: hypothetical protein EOO46_20515 [Flavobacterium sp.]